MFQIVSVICINFVVLLVFVTDLLVYISGLFYFWKNAQLKSDTQSTYLLQSLIAPAIILIDYGHFQ